MTIYIEGDNEISPLTVVKWVVAFILVNLLIWFALAVVISFTTHQSLLPPDFFQGIIDALPDINFSPNVGPTQLEDVKSMLTPTPGP